MFNGYFLHSTFVLAEVLSSKGTHLVESKANNGSFVMHGEVSASSGDYGLVSLENGLFADSLVFGRGWQKLLTHELPPQKFIWTFSDTELNYTDKSCSRSRVSETPI